jgi:hypothetical protein
MMFEHTYYGSLDRYWLHRISEQVANQTHAACMRNFHEHREVWSMLPERRVGRMPDTLPTVDTAVGFDLSPLWIEGVTAMTYPFGTELPRMTMPAALHQKPPLT